jgi:hypothetical protein
VTGVQRAGLASGINWSFLGATVQSVCHIGDEAGDLGHGIGLFERPVNDFNDLVIISRKPVAVGTELIASSNLTEWFHSLRGHHASRRRFAKVERAGRGKSRRSKAGSISTCGRIARRISPSIDLSPSRSFQTRP